MKTSTLIVKLKNLIKDYPDTSGKITIRIALSSCLNNEIKVTGNKQDILDYIHYDLKRFLPDMILLKNGSTPETPAYWVHIMSDDLYNKFYLVSDTDLLDSKTLLTAEEINSHLLGVLNDNAGLKDCYVSVLAIMADGTEQELVDDYDSIYKDLQFEKEKYPDIGIVWNDSKSKFIELMTEKQIGRAMFRTIIVTFSDCLDWAEESKYYKQYTIKPNAGSEGFVPAP